MMTEAKPAAAKLRFSTGAREAQSQVFYQQAQQLATSATTLPLCEIPPGNWLAEASLLFVVAATGNSATVALQGDAPWSLLQEVAWLDAAGNSIHSVTGYDLYLINLLGGFAFSTDPTASPFYSALTTGSAGTAGSGQFLLHVPIEIIQRDGIGVYPNGGSNATTRLRIILAPSTAVYSTAPTTLPTVTVYAVARGYQLPAVDSPAGNAYATEPPGVGTFQQWSRVAYDFAAGDRTIPFQRKGQWYRTLIFVFRDSSGVRSNSMLSSTQLGNFRVDIDGVSMLNGPYGFLRDQMWRRQQIAAANLPTGVLQLSMAHEWDGKVGGEMRDSWVYTAPGTIAQAVGNFAATGTLTVITNEIVVDPETRAEIVRA